MSTQINWRKASSRWGKAVAEHPDTSSDALSVLACHHDVEVRMAVADHKNTLIATLMLLAQTDSVDLRYAIAENHNIGAEVLKLLADDVNPFVAHRALKTLNRNLGALVLPFPAQIVQVINLRRDIS